MTRYAFAALGLLALLPCTAAWSGEPSSGRPLVLDGDTLHLRGTVVGLYGIAAPGPTQTCWDAKGLSTPCGARAMQALTDHIGDRSVTCEPRGMDRHRRAVAVCRLGEEDLAGWMVANGLAVADRLSAPDYVAQDTRAWAKRHGLWAGVFEDPSERVRTDHAAQVKLSALGK